MGDRQDQVAVETRELVALQGLTSGQPTPPDEPDPKLNVLVCYHGHPYPHSVGMEADTVTANKNSRDRALLDRRMVSHDHETPSIKKSYRQVGNRTFDRAVLQHAPKLRSLVTTVPSIPTKYPVPEIHEGHQMDKAFNISTQRFTEKPDPLPGPGAYHHSTTLVKDVEHCPSLSQRGYGLLASKSSRFNDNDFLESRLAPGPGAYYDSSNQPKSHRAASDSKRPNAVFVKGKRSRIEEPGLGAPTDQPGVGQYEVAASALKTLPKGPDGGWIFRSKTVRNRLSRSAEDVPEPGRYDVAHASNVLFEQGKVQGPNSFFSSRSGRDLLSKNTNQTPSPGQYDVARAVDALKRDLATATKSSSTFMVGSTDRFGRRLNRKTIEPETPGPGWYSSTAPPSLTRSKSSLSSFKSLQDRMPKLNPRDVRPPGPAYYKPELGGRRSFFLNSTKRWI